jgi:hypothetical protein
MGDSTIRVTEGYSHLIDSNLVTLVKEPDHPERSPGICPTYAHLSQAICALVFEWNWEESKREFERALEINPGYIQGAA